MLTGREREFWRLGRKKERSSIQFCLFTPNCALPSFSFLTEPCFLGVIHPPTNGHGLYRTIHEVSISPVNDWFGNRSGNNSGQ